MAQSYDLRFDLWSGFERMAIGSAAGFLQAGRIVLLITSPHLLTLSVLVAKSRAVGLMPRSRTDFTDRRRPWRDDSSRDLLAPLWTYTLQLREGITMYPSNSSRLSLLDTRWP